LKRKEDALLSAFYNTLTSLFNLQKYGIFVGLAGSHSNMGNLVTLSTFNPDPEFRSELPLPFFKIKYF